MKLLLDESVPRQLARFLPDSFEIHTLQQMGWAGCANGDLLRRAADCEFQALVTVDQRTEFDVSSGMVSGGPGNGCLHVPALQGCHPMNERRTPLAEPNHQFARVGTCSQPAERVDPLCASLLPRSAEANAPCCRQLSLRRP